MGTAYLNSLTMCFFILMTTCFYNAQELENKKIQAGLTTSFGLNFANMGSSKMDENGLGTNFSIGLLMHKSFKDSKNLGIATGLEFDFGSLKFAKSASSPEIFYNYTDREILPSSNTSKNLFSLANRKHKTTQVSIPIALLFRTDMIGDFRYFTKFGLRNSFVISNKMIDEGTDKTGSAQVEKTNDGMTSKNEMFFFQASVGLSIGAEWNFIGSTCLVAEMSYYYGLTPLFLDKKDENKTLYNNVDGVIKPFSNKATLNQLNLKFAVLF
jgi:hypothetical protein